MPIVTTDNLRIITSTLRKILRSSATTRQLAELVAPGGQFSGWLARPPQRARVALALAGAEVVGWACINPDGRPTWAPVPLIGWFVRPEWRRKGIATLLAKALLLQQRPRLLGCTPWPRLAPILVRAGYGCTDAGALSADGSSVDRWAQWAPAAVRHG